MLLLEKESEVAREIVAGSNPPFRARFVMIRALAFWG
jgi:hypothetical protein